ncbi:glutamate-cysteine ligase family protein [Adlercreutzia sp. ZJ141]|uniref:glutamate-cysteine ligase family protein n=1 Tax=Adlercreutzia sp. ZJ141 TaxID=2709406 RepID=UPI0013EC5FE7|nr:glutamate-cysteine ligase family protein [Adlercreutzia sp. ZJ141]
MISQRSTAPNTPNQPANATSQPAREDNIRAIVSYFESGIKPHETLGNVGIELEHTIVRHDLSPVPYSGDAGVASVLEALSKDYPSITRDDAGDILGVARAGESITIEPAAQIELSAGPFADLHRARDVFDNFEATLDRELTRIGAQALATGYHPTARALDLELIPKRRYELMNTYLSATDTCGPCMMRGSASTQVSIDYISVDDCLRKLRLACTIVPVLSLICDNSPVFEGVPRTKKLVRTHIWNHMDADRCGIVPGALSTSFTLEAYAAYILDTPAILVQDPATHEWVADARTFGDIYATRTMERADVEHALSMFFTDVRLKTYIEIRPADTMPVPYAIAYAALIKGLFYNEHSLRALEQLIGEPTEEDVVCAKHELMTHGYKARVYGSCVADICDDLLAIAHAGLPDDEREVIEPLETLVEARTTLADITERTGFLRADSSVHEVEQRTN